MTIRSIPSFLACETISSRGVPLFIMQVTGIWLQSYQLHCIAIACGASRPYGFDKRTPASSCLSELAQAFAFQLAWIREVGFLRNGRLLPHDCWEGPNPFQHIICTNECFRSILEVVFGISRQKRCSYELLTTLSLFSWDCTSQHGDEETQSKGHDVAHIGKRSPSEAWRNVSCQPIKTFVHVKCILSYAVREEYKNSRTQLTMAFWP